MRCNVLLVIFLSMFQVAVAMGNVKITVYYDGDHDSYPDQNKSLVLKNNQKIPEGYIVKRPDGLWDCDDTKASVNPAAREVCNLIDDNCNGQSDENVTTVYYLDNDRDGFGNPLVTSKGCTPPSGYVINSTDCNDANISVNPNAKEICNVIDDNCNGLIDEGLALTTYYADDDRDGAGNANKKIVACLQPEGYVTNSNDCNDADSHVITPQPYFIDADNDGYGSAAVTLCSSTVPIGYSIQGGDCNDGNSGTHPNAFEIYNGVDDDCNGLVDEYTTNPLINGSCDELTQWTRNHTEVSMFSEPFSTNYANFHTSFGTFTNGQAFSHYIANGALNTGFNFKNCVPWPIRTQDSCGKSKCMADDLGCFTTTFDFYPEACRWYGSHGVSMIVNINAYIPDWTTQRKYIDIALGNGVKVIGVVMSTELAAFDNYATSFYFPNGTVDYVRVWTKMRDSVKKYYPTIPVGIWGGNVWDNRGVMFQYNTAIQAAGQSADFIGLYGQNKNVAARLLNTEPWTEQKAIDTALAYSYWLPKWIDKSATWFGNKPIAMLTDGTDPATEEWLQKTFLGTLQTEYQVMVQQMDSSGKIWCSEEYRTREFTLEQGNAVADITNLIHFGRGAMYSKPTHKEWIVTGNRQIVGVKFTAQDGHGWMEIINFSDKDWAAGAAVEGWSAAMLSPYKSALHYNENFVRAKSIGFVTF